MNFPLFLFGYRTVETDADHAAALLNECMQAKLTLSDFEATAEGNIRFRVGALSGKRLERVCKKEKIPVKVTAGGFPHHLGRFFHRKGLLVGLLFGVFLLILSQKFVWSVRVSGNEKLTAGEIREVLAGEGLAVGSYLPTLNLSAIETRTLLRNDDLSWIAIHMEGTVAEVQVTERARVPEKNTRPANLIAERDGQIEELELYRGQAVVNVGQPVRAGDLLVSGVYDSQTVGYRFTRAAGNVLARTEREFRVEIPLSYEEKVYGKPVAGGFQLHFFGILLNFLKNSRNEPDLCDIIESTTGKDWLGLHDLPVSVSQRTYLPYTVTTARRSAEEALELAYASLNEQLSTLSPAIRLSEKQIRTQIGEESVVLECRLICVENIAVQQEFDVNDP